jgi:hypothetical protein
VKFQIIDTAENRQLILLIVSKASGISLSTMAGQSRARPHVLSRQICFKIYSEHLGLTLDAIGEYTGTKKRHHTTIMAAIRRVNDLLHVGDSQTSALWALVSQELSAIFKTKKFMRITFDNDTEIPELIEYLHAHKLTQYEIY